MISRAPPFCSRGRFYRGSRISSLFLIENACYIRLIIAILQRIKKKRKINKITERIYLPPFFFFFLNIFIGYILSFKTLFWTEFTSK